MNFPSKELDQLTIEEVASIHVGTTSPIMTKSHRVLSTLGVIVGEMRHANTMNNSNIFVPLLCSFSILDQIGTCYQDPTKTQPPSNVSGVKKSLHNFCSHDYRSAEVAGLYAFRNGLMHDASFTSCDRNGNWYYFRFDANLQKVIEPASRQWNGLASDLSHQTTTYVNGQELQNMVQVAVSGLASTMRSNPSNIAITASREELIHKYLLWMKRSTGQI